MHFKCLKNTFLDISYDSEHFFLGHRKISDIIFNANNVFFPNMNLWS